MTLEEFIKILEKYPKDTTVKFSPDPVYDPDKVQMYEEDYIFYNEKNKEIII